MARTVTFGPSEGARDAHSDEREVMRSFHKHVKHCDTCYNGLASWRSGEPLCAKGHNYVIDMNPYLFCRSGKPYSMIDRKSRNEVTRVLVPDEYRHVATLFEALAYGYQTKPRRPRVIIEQTTAPPVRAPEPRRDTLVIPVSSRDRGYVSPRSPRTSDRHYHERSPREPRSRGSLYYEDERRRHRYDDDVVIIQPTFRYRL